VVRITKRRTILIRRCLMKKKSFLWSMMVLGILLTVITATLVMAAYSSHQNDQDVNNFLAVYSFAKSTKLDDCSLCHPGGTISGKSYGSCDYCHKTYGLDGSGTVPLNSYGQDYEAFGRSQAAFGVIDFQNKDSDGDGKINLEEIQALTFPGDPNDYPGLVSAPVIGLNLERILKLPDHSQLLLLNASKSQDFYARYRGVKIMDLLKYAGVSKGATHITVFSPDGYSQTFPIDAPDPQSPSGIQYDVMGPYPYGTYYGGLDFVDYSFIPNHLDYGDRIPDKLYMLLAYIRDGDPLTPGKINPTTLKLDGEGPYRLIPPQKIAGNPDRPSTAPPVGDGWDYNANNDHNAGFSARTVAAIRVEPLPSGTTDFNWFEGGWNLVDKARLIIYGAINPRKNRVWGMVTDEKGESVDDVQISFGLVSLGQVGQATSEFRGKFRKELPVGEYVAVPTKEGYIFYPESIAFQLTEHGYEMKFTAYPVP
jgi:hypothetical protein